MGHRRPWTAEEDSRIQDLWASCTVAQIATALQRDRNALRLHAYELGLPKKPKSDPISIVLQQSMPATASRPRRSPALLPRRQGGYAGVGRAFLFLGVVADRRRETMVFVTHGERIQPLPPRSDLVASGDDRLDWRKPSGLRQLAVAILGWLRPDPDTVERLLDAFLRQFGPLLRSSEWELPGIDVERWLAGRPS